MKSIAMPVDDAFILSFLFINTNIIDMFMRIARRFATTTNKTYGNLKDSDRIFTNVYKDTDPYISGALRRVFHLSFRETGIAPKISSSTVAIGLSIKLRLLGLGEEEELDSPQD